MRILFDQGTPVPLRNILNSHQVETALKCQDENGFFGERAFISLVRRPNAVAVLWKQRFTKKDGDFVAEALFVESNGKYLVDHAMVW